MSFWYDRLKIIRMEKEITQYALSKVIDADISTVSRYESGRGAKTLTRNMKRKLATIFNEYELQYIEDGTKINKNDMVEDPGEVYKGNDDNINIPYHKEVYASAGGGSENHSMANASPITFSKHFLNTFLGVYNLKGISIINAAGDSMSPTIMSGELMFVCAMDNEEFKDGGIYVLMCSNVLLVKRVTYDPFTREYTLVSDNGKVKSVTLTIDEGNDCHFVGRVVGHLDRV